MDSIWLLKSIENDDRLYSEKVSHCGLLPVHIPTLTFKFTNQGPLKNALANPQDHSGIIFTSKRAVEAVTQLYNTLNVSVHHQWNEKKIFVVGEATSNAVLSQLKLSTIGKESGNVQQLAPIIFREVAAFEKPLLYPCGNLGRDELPKLLVSQDRDFKALTCYETSENPQMRSKIKEQLAEKKPKYLVFFSPSGVNFALGAFKALSFSFTDVRIIAIGPTTNAAIVKEGLPVFGVCQSPTPDSLVHIIKSPV